MATSTEYSRRFFLRLAREERFDHRLYEALAHRDEDGANAPLFEQLAAQEERHLEFWARLAGRPPGEVESSRLRLGAAVLAGRLLGPAFTIRRLEAREEATIDTYEQILSSGTLPLEQGEELRAIISDERRHEKEIERRIADERVAYLGAAVLGLNDALIELTGGLTGLVSSVADTKLIGFTGLVIGVAAALSMAASNFLSSGMSSEEARSGLRPARAAAYTGTAYLAVVVALVAPFFLFARRSLALGVTWAIALMVIAGFAFYSATLQEASFRRRFLQMMALGLGVAVITFTIGRIVSAAVGISA